MVREFSEEKRQEIFRLLDEIDNREWKSFMEWCGSSAEEFGDWPDKLAVSAYTMYVDKYHKKVLETNEMTRNRVNTVFENVTEIETRYAGHTRECQVKIKEQIDMVRTMTEFMESMTDGKLNMALLSKGSVNESDSQNNKKMNTPDQRYEGELPLEVVVLDIPGEEVQVEEVINVSEITFVNQITNFIDGRSDYLDYDASIAELDCLYERGLISGENYNWLKEIIDTISKGNDKDYDIEDLREQAREAYAEVEEKLLEFYISEDTLIALGWNLDMIDPRLGKNFIEDMKALMLEYGLTDERSIIFFLVTITHECGRGSKITETGGKAYLNGKPKYAYNTRGAGVIQLTGGNQKVFLQYLYDHSNDKDERDQLQEYINGFYETKSTIDGKVVTKVNNIYDVATFIAENYALEASIWYWCNNEYVVFDEQPRSINYLIETCCENDKTDLEQYLIATQLTVHGCVFKPEVLGRFYNSENQVFIDNGGRANIIYKEYGADDRGEHHFCDKPGNWEDRRNIYRMMISYIMQNKG